MLPAGDKPIRYKYIYIWSSKDELRAKCTDPATLEMIIRAIGKSKHHEAFKDIEIERRQDISKITHVINIKGMQEEGDYRSLAWWMFRALCDKGWEPMETGKMSYKLKSKEAYEA
ncbi:MAG: hypothetical protein H8D34_20970 [Chloroflexi bacterium]|nr:hypothetical protein [Chloroflexota bacterium]